mmetsp:Transcript_11511/g.18867  ORF Transcript_11511/g.18867 Transcript_11511/m.18867 type:complete len:269 (+) Transcript_11511:2177-2983(+)
MNTCFTLAGTNAVPQAASLLPNENLINPKSTLVTSKCCLSSSKPPYPALCNSNFVGSNNTQFHCPCVPPTASRHSLAVLPASFAVCTAEVVLLLPPAFAETLSETILSYSSLKLFMVAPPPPTSVELNTGNSLSHNKSTVMSAFLLTSMLACTSPNIAITSLVRAFRRPRFTVGTSSPLQWMVINFVRALEALPTWNRTNAQDTDASSTDPTSSWTPPDPTPNTLTAVETVLCRIVRRCVVIAYDRESSPSLCTMQVYLRQETHKENQ